MEPVHLAVAVVLACAASVALFRTKRAPDPAPKPVALWFSASDGYGGYFSGGELRRYNPDPVSLVSAAGSVSCINLSHNGMRLSELLRGGVLANGTPEVFGGTGAVIACLRDQLALVPGQLAVIGAGMADILLDQISPKQHTLLLHEAISDCRDAGVHVALLGFSRFTPTGVVDASAVARLAEGDATVRRVAAELGVPYIDRSSVEPRPAEDGLHLQLECHEEAARVIAPQLAAIVAGVKP